MFEVQVLKSRFKLGALIMQQKVEPEISEKLSCLPIVQNLAECANMHARKIAKSVFTSSIQIIETDCSCVLTQVFTGVSERGLLLTL